MKEEPKQTSREIFPLHDRCRVSNPSYGREQAIKALTAAEQEIEEKTETIKILVSEFENKVAELIKSNQSYNALDDFYRKQLKKDTDCINDKDRLIYDLTKEIKELKKENESLNKALKIDQDHINDQDQLIYDQVQEIEGLKSVIDSLNNESIVKQQIKG